MVKKEFLRLKKRNFDVEFIPSRCFQYKIEKMPQPKKKTFF